ncbi:MAG: hypothetical protein KAU28_01715 [Phycisphaerae bacterium]|nr:hypothetical protein [Phycisphaerae bacterium]
MPSYKDLLKLIQQGKSPAEIIERMPMPPSKFRRMLGGKHMQARLKLEADLAAAVVSHKTTTGVHNVAKRLIQLMQTKNPETVRKVCLALLSEGLQTVEADQPSAPRCEPPPWMQLLSLDQGQTTKSPPKKQTKPPEPAKPRRAEHLKASKKTRRQGGRNI